MQQITGRLLSDLMQAAHFYGIGVRVTSDDRTYDQQAALAKRKSKLPAAAAGTSQHEYGFAFDAVPIPDTPANRSLLGKLAKLVGLNWSTTDSVHFQVFSRSTWKKVLAGGAEIFKQPVPANPSYTFDPFAGTMSQNAAGEVRLNPVTLQPIEEAPSYQENFLGGGIHIASPLDPLQNLYGIRLMKRPGAAITGITPYPGALPSTGTSAPAAAGAGGSLPAGTGGTTTSTGSTGGTGTPRQNVN